MPVSSQQARYPRVTKTLRPRQHGTVKLFRRYGAALVCVRYRQDGRGQRRCTTVELIIDEGPVQRRPSERTIVHVPIAWSEEELRQRAKAMGARWINARRAWRMTLRVANALGLADRIDRHGRQQPADEPGP